MAYEYKTGAFRSQRMPRFDLIPKVFLYRLAERYAGVETSEGPKGGALEYGEVNWMKGLPTSDVISHIINHLTSYSDALRFALLNYGSNMEYVKRHMVEVSLDDDHLAGAAWGIAALMHQEEHGMFHDDKYKTGSPADDVTLNEMATERKYTTTEAEAFMNHLKQMGFTIVPIGEPVTKKTKNAGRKNSKKRR